MRKMETFSAEAPPLAVSKDEIEVQYLVFRTFKSENEKQTITMSKGMGGGGSWLYKFGNHCCKQI